MMLNFEQAFGEIAAPATGPTTGGLALVEDVEPMEQATPWVAATRMLEVATATADQLVEDARIEAETLVATARAEADAIAEAGRHEAERLAAELTRTREEQVAELDHERETALSGLAEEQATLEARIDALRTTEADQRHRMRQHLTQHLSMLDAHQPEAAAATD